MFDDAASVMRVDWWEEPHPKPRPLFVSYYTLGQGLQVRHAVLECHAPITVGGDFDRLVEELRQLHPEAERVVVINWRRLEPVSVGGTVLHTREQA